MEERRPKPVTRAYLENAAGAYLERYASSLANLRRILTRKVERRCRATGEDPAAYAEMVEEVVRRFQEAGLVDDRRYAEAKVASLRRRGASAPLVAARLEAKGVARDLIDAALAEDARDERAAAEAFARRRRLGVWRTSGRAENRAKDLAALARAGFGFDLAKKVVDAEPDS